MEKILVVGVNTRPVACSARKLGFTVYSADYFCTQDLRVCSNHQKCVLTQRPYESCGKFMDSFDPLVLEDLSADFVNETDFILCCTGVLPERFPESKVIGNKKIEAVENKYKLYKKLKTKFSVPETFRVSDVQEASGIIADFKDRRFVLKPVIASGGMGIKEFSDNYELDGMILQERIEGENISASVLSTGKDAKTILTSKQMLGRAELGQMEPFGYCGNLTPLQDDPGIAETAEEVVEYLSLVGSNGVDMIYDGSNIHVIEVNPRFQGTFECAELLTGINMVDAHIKACDGILIETKPPHNFAVKMIVFARERSLVGDLNFEGVFDIPNKNVIIEKGEPVATVIKTGKTPEAAIYSARKTVSRVYKSLKYYKIHFNH